MARNCLLAMGLAACLPWQTPAAEGGLSPEVKADFEWFSGLGFPDVRNASFARVATGSWSQSGGEAPKGHYVLGFVLSTNGNAFTALDMDLFQHTYTNSAAGTAEYKRVGFELIALKEWAGVWLDHYEKPRERDVEADLWRRFGERVTERSQIFVLAWACWRQGLEDEARRLYAVAQTTRKPTGRDDSGLSLRSKLEKDLSLSLMWRAVLDFGEPAITRKELLARFRAIETNCPGSEYHARAKATAERLAIMIAEDERHAKSPPKPLAELPMEERIRELIFQLRDQNGQQWCQPGECDIFLNPQNATNTPAHQLVSIGYPAVPQLLAALDDPTFTRSVGFHRNFYFSHTVLTVGDCAAFILNRIAGKAFYKPQSTSSYLSKDGDVAQVRKAAQAWWAEFQSKGEKQMLVEATEAGNAPGQARFLWQRYPEAAVDAVHQGGASQQQYLGPRATDRAAGEVRGASGE